MTVKTQNVDTVPSVPPSVPSGDCDSGSDSKVC